MLCTQLTRGEYAIELLESSGFKQKWGFLAAKCPGFTRLQEPDFLGIWYQVYQEVYEPVIITALDEREELVAFLGLAWHKQGHYLQHAGNAEYHGWLCSPELEVPFLQAVLSCIREQLSIKKWEWHWMPSGLGADSLKTAMGPNEYLVVEEQFAPVWDLSDRAKLNKVLKNKSLKSKFNRYKKRGDFRFELITDPGKLKKTLAIAKDQYDLRREALNNVRPFAEDHYMIAFCSKLLAIPGLLHVSTLWLDDQLLACHMGVSDKQRVCLGMISHDPTESKQSPGTLLLAELAKSLTKNGYQLFDLTPGTNSYKDRYANASQILYKPTIYFSKASYFSGIAKHSLTTTGKKILGYANVSVPAMRKWKTNLKEFSTKIRLPLKKKLPFLYEINISNNIFFTYLSGSVHVQAYQDLLKYQDQKPYLSRRELLQIALRKFSQGEVLYSKVQDGRLIWFAWKKKTTGKIRSRNNPKEIQLPPESEILYDFYLHSIFGDKEMFYDNLLYTIKEIHHHGTKLLHVCLDEDFQQIGEKLKKACELTRIDMPAIFKDSDLINLKP